MCRDEIQEEPKLKFYTIGEMDFIKTYQTYNLRRISIWLRYSPDHKQLKKSPILNQNEGIWQLVVKTIVAG